MASVNPRRNKAGEIVSRQVKWRPCGARSGPWQTERFDDEDSADVLRSAVDENGRQWPLGWVKGRGYIDPTGEIEERYVFANFARQSVEDRTGVEDRYRDAMRKELETCILPAFGNCDVRSTDHFSKTTVSAWVNRTAKTEVWRGSAKKPMSQRP